MKLVAIFNSSRAPAPILSEIKECKHFEQLCEHFPTDWAHLVDVETGQILESYYNEGNYIACDVGADKK